MAFIPYSNEKKGKVFITVQHDAQRKGGRIQLNVCLCRKLGCEQKEISLFLFFDQDTRRIGIARNYVAGKPFKFDKKAYADATNFLDDNDIEYREGPVRYFYECTKDDMMIFNATREYNGEECTTLRAEKNGNLQRC